MFVKMAKRKLEAGKYVSVTFLAVMLNQIITIHMFEACLTPAWLLLALNLITKNCDYSTSIRTVYTHSFQCELSLV